MTTNLLEGERCAVQQRSSVQRLSHALSDRALRTGRVLVLLSLDVKRLQYA